MDWRIDCIWFLFIELCLVLLASFLLSNVSLSYSLRITHLLTFLLIMSIYLPFPSYLPFGSFCTFYASSCVVLCCYLCVRCSLPLGQHFYNCIALYPIYYIFSYLIACNALPFPPTYIFALCIVCGVFHYTCPCLVFALYLCLALFVRAYTCIHCVACCALPVTFVWHCAFLRCFVFFLFLTLRFTYILHFAFTFAMYCCYFVRAHAWRLFAFVAFCFVYFYFAARTLWRVVAFLRGTHAFASAACCRLRRRRHLFTFNARCSSRRVPRVRAAFLAFISAHTHLYLTPTNLIAPLPYLPHQCLILSLISNSMSSISRFLPDIILIPGAILYTICCSFRADDAVDLVLFCGWLATLHIV